MTTESALRASGHRLVDVVKANQSAWASKNSVVETSAWNDVSVLLDALDDFVSALEAAGEEDDASSSPDGKKCTPPAELVSLSELSASHSALELVALWGVVGLVDDGLRSAGQARRSSRAAKIPIMALKRRPCDARVDRMCRLEKVAATLERCLRRETLSPVTNRFASDCLAVLLQLDQLSSSSDRARSFVEAVPSPGIARALRELLGGAVVDPTSSQPVPPPKWCVSACSELLAAVARSSLTSIMNEFAGDSELDAETGADAPAIERGLAAALGSVARVDDPGYVRDVAPQLVEEVVRAENANNARSRIAVRALSTISIRSPQVVVRECAGCFATRGVRDEDSLERDLDLLVRISARAEMVNPFLHDFRVVSALVSLSCFCLDSKRSKMLERALAVLASMARADAASFAAIVDDVLRHDENVCFGPGPTGSVEMRANPSPGNALPESVGDVVAKIPEPAAVGAVFARLLRTHFLQRDDETGGRGLYVLVKLAEMLDAGALDASGAAILETVSVIVEARSSDDSSHDDELEQVALGSLLAILELGSEERDQDEERILKSLSKPLEILSAPDRPSSASLAAECRVRILTRGATRRSPSDTKPPQSWRQALEAASRDLAADSPPAVKASGIVSLTQYARAATRRRQVADFDDSLLPGPDDWEPVASALVEALSDDESYVYLAAAHSLAALADANPQTILPFLCEAHETGRLLGPHGKLLNEHTIAKLGEALVCAVKRRGSALPAYAPKLARALIRGARPDAPDPSPEARCARFSALADLAALAKHSIAPIALDIVDLVTATLDLEQRQQGQPKNAEEKRYSTRRAAAFLAAQLLAGSGGECIDECPRPTARMCRRLKAIVENIEEDQTTQRHAAFGLEKLDEVIDKKMNTPIASDGAGRSGDSDRWILPIVAGRDDWIERELNVRS